MTIKCLNQGIIILYLIETPILKSIIFLKVDIILHGNDHKSS